MNISKATLSEIPIIQEIAQKSWRKHYPGIISEEQITYMLDKMYSESEIKNHFVNPNYQYFLIKNNNDFVGIMGFEHHYEPKTTKLHRIYFLEEAKGKGLGTFALNFLKNEVEKSGDKRIILNVNKENPSYYFYLARNFKVYEEIVLQIGNGFVMDDYLMEIYL